MLTPDRIPVAEGKKMENILKNDPSFPRKEGSRFSTKISAGRKKWLVFAVPSANVLAVNVLHYAQIFTIT